MGTGDRAHPLQLAVQVVRRRVDRELPGSHRRQQRCDRFHEWLIGRTHAGRAGTDQHRGLLPMQIAGCFRDDARLSHAGFAAYEDDLTGALRGKVPGVCQRGQLPAAPDEGGTIRRTPASRQRR